MKKDLLEENTKKRWKKLAGINEGRMGLPDATRMSTKKGIITVVTKDGGIGEQESEDVLIIGEKNPTMSSGWMYSWQWPVDAEPGQPKITGKLSGDQVGWNKYEGFYLQDDATYEQIRGDIRQAKLSSPLSPEEEANLQPADEMPSLPTMEVPGEEDPEAVAAARERSRDVRDLLNRGMFGVGRPLVAEGKNLKVKK